MYGPTPQVAFCALYDVDARLYAQASKEDRLWGTCSWDSQFSQLLRYQAEQLAQDGGRV